MNDEENPKESPDRRAASDLRKMRLALKDAVDALLREAKLTNDETRCRMLESFAVKRALLAEAIDTLLANLGCPMSESELQRREQAGEEREQTSTRAERRLFEISSRIKRRCSDDGIRSLMTDVQKASGGLAASSLERGICL